MKTIIANLACAVAVTCMRLVGIPELTINSSNIGMTFHVEKGSHFQIVLPLGPEEPQLPRDKVAIDDRFLKLEKDWITKDAHPDIQGRPIYIRHLKFEAVGENVMPDHCIVVVPTPHGPFWVEIKVIERRSQP